MKLIEMDCPECSTELKLDAGFAGGICRCASCGTLMTVPAKNSRGRAERLDRPDAPGGSSRPDSPVSRKSSKSASKSKSKGGAPASGTYVTASGKKVTITKKTKVPVAGARIKAARYTTIGVFAAVMLVALVGAVWLGLVLIQDMRKADEDPYELVEAFAYQSGVNPLSIVHPNIVGIPASRDTVVLLDLSEGSGEWWPNVKTLLLSGMAGHDSPMQLNLIAATGDGLKKFKSGTVKASTIDEASLRSFLDGLQPSGQVNLAEFLEEGLDDKPNQVVLITGQAPESGEADGIAKAAEDATDVTIDVVALGGDSVVLDDLTVAHQGRYAFIGSWQMGEWMDAAP